jgi:hypothetical protein
MNYKIFVLQTETKLSETITNSMNIAINLNNFETNDLEQISRALTDRS